MLSSPYIHAFILSLLPISELRGGIPYAVTSDIPLWAAFVLCVLSNMLVIPICYLFFDTLHKQFYKIGLYKKLFDKWVERTRKKAERNVAKYGYWGVMLFVAIPLPITGAYTGTLASWILELDRKKSFKYLAGGVIIAGIIVSLATISGIKAFEIFMKN